jgi:hypothetical protein
MPGFLPNQLEDTGLYIPTTDVYEVSRIGEVDVNSEEFKLLLIRLYQNLNSIVLALNLKDSAMYVENQFITGQVFFSIDPVNPDNLRNTFRIVIDMGPLAAGVNTVAHGLTVQSTWQFTRIYGTATNYVAGAAAGDYYPLPWASAGGATNIELKVNNQNVVITNNSGVTFAKCYVILEWLKA